MTKRNMHVLRGLQVTLQSLAIGLVLMGYSPVAIAAGPISTGLQCNDLGKKITLSNYSLTFKQFHTIQRQLLALGYKLGSDKGSKVSIIPALRDFCKKPRFAYKENLQLMLSDHVAIHKVYPDWKAILGSKPFQEWMMRQPDSTDIDHVRKFGDSSQVIGLLDRYHEFQIKPQPKSKLKPKPKPKLKPKPKPKPKPKSKPRPRPRPQPKPQQESYVSYELTKADFKQLKSSQKLVDAIARLSSKPYADVEAFKTKAKKAMNGVPSAEEYVGELAGYGTQQIKLSLAKSSFDELKVEKVPAYILQTLAGFQGLQYPDKKFSKTMASALSALAARAEKLKPELSGFAQLTPIGIGMTQYATKAMLKAYPKDPLVATVAKWLASMPSNTTMSKNFKAFSQAIDTKLTAMENQINQAKPKVIKAAVRIPQFVIDKAGADSVAKEVRQSIVPGIVLKLIAGLEGVDYPEESLFRKAIEVKLDFSSPTHSIRKSIDSVIDALGSNRLDNELLSEWTKAKLPAEILNQLRTLQGKRYGSVRSFKYAVHKKLRELEWHLVARHSRGSYLRLILAQASKPHSFDKQQQILWDGDGFGCVSHRLAGDVYGFYPYWMAGKKLQPIDFSMQNRIDYFGLSLGDRGNIADHRNWTQKDDAQESISDAIRTAHTHCAKVDLVIYRDNWMDWLHRDALNKGTFFKLAAGNIASLINEPLNDPLSKAIPYLTLGGRSVPTMGDGVTLYFPHYPRSPESVASFDEFIRLLSAKLKKKGRGYAVNLMFPSAKLGEGIYGYSQLLNFMNDVEQGGKLKARFLMLLHAPITKDKKLVRKAIEDHLHGDNRVKLLRHIVMVIEPKVESKQQLNDDVIYAKDNFGGIGLWMQPLMPAAESTIIKALQKHYQIGKAPIPLKAEICGFVCPHRWWFRIAWEICGLILLISIPLYMRACKLRSIFDRYFILFVAGAVIPFALLSYALLTCDPALEEISKGNSILILMIAGIIAYSVWNYRHNKSKARLP